MSQTSRLQSVTSTNRHYERQSTAIAASEIPFVQITAPPPVALKAELGRAQTSTRSTIALFSTPAELEAQQSGKPVYRILSDEEQIQRHMEAVRGRGPTIWQIDPVRTRGLSILQHKHAPRTVGIVSTVFWLGAVVLITVWSSMKRPQYGADKGPSCVTIARPGFNG